MSRKLGLAFVLGALAALVACASPRPYEICDTANCGDNVAISVE